MAVPQFTPCPGGFITVRELPDGRTLIEGWTLTLDPMDGGEPRHDTAYHWIAASDAETADTIAEFAGWLGQPVDATA